MFYRELQERNGFPNGMQLACSWEEVRGEEPGAPSLDTGAHVLDITLHYLLGSGLLMLELLLWRCQRNLSLWSFDPYTDVVKCKT